MKSRLEHYRSLRKKQKLKYSLFSSVVIFPSLFFAGGALSSTPGTFAWYSSETAANGSIQSATTSDLLKITAGEVVCGKNSKVSNSVTITNISHLDTTVFIGMGKYSASKWLQPGESFTFHFEINNIKSSGDGTSIHYQIQAFKNYVNETFSVAINQDKLNATQKDKEENEIPSNEPTKDDSNQANTETQSNEGLQESQNGVSETAPNDKNNGDETTQPDENNGDETTQDDENNGDGTTQDDESNGDGTTQNDENNEDGTTQTDENGGNPTPVDTPTPPTNPNQETAHQTSQ
jgi:hypothetical protein